MKSRVQPLFESRYFATIIRGIHLISSVVAKSASSSLEAQLGLVTRAWMKQQQVRPLEELTAQEEGQEIEVEVGYKMLEGEEIATMRGTKQTWKRPFQAQTMKMGGAIAR